MVVDARSWFIKPGYTARTEAFYFDDAGEQSVVHQPDAYPFAAHIARRAGCDTIIDIGCGGGQKLAQLHPDFALIGVDFGSNIDYCRATYPFGEWMDWDLETGGVLALEEERLRRSVIICSDVIEHLVDPSNLLEMLRSSLRTAPYAVLTTPERDLVRGVDDPGPPANPSHVREWNLAELEQLLIHEGLRVAFSGLTMNNSVSLQKRSSLLVLKGDALPSLTPAPAAFRVRAFVSACNAEDIIEPSLHYLIGQGVEAHLLDCGSTDATVESASRLLGRGVVAVERIEADAPGSPAGWHRLQKRIEALSAEADADWLLVQDICELRVSPWPGASLRDALAHVDRSGYTAVAHTVIAFPPVEHDRAEDGEAVTAACFAFVDNARQSREVLCWKHPGSPPVSVDAEVGRRVFPFNFLSHRYPVAIEDGEVVERRSRRSSEHAARRLAPRRTQDLHAFDADTFPALYLVERLSGIGSDRG